MHLKRMHYELGFLMVLGMLLKELFNPEIIQVVVKILTRNVLAYN